MYLAAAYGREAPAVNVGVPVTVMVRTLLFVPLRAKVAFAPFVSVATLPPEVRVTEAPAAIAANGWLKVVVMTSPMATFPVAPAGVSVEPRLTGAEAKAANAAAGTEAWAGTDAAEVTVGSTGTRSSNGDDLV